MKNWYILKFSSFLVANYVFFFSVENLVDFLTKASLTTNLFLVERLYFFKPPSFSKSTQQLHKIFKNLNFWYFCQFRSEFDAFFHHKLLLTLQKSPRTTNCFLVERVWDSKLPSFCKNTQKLNKIFKNLNFLVFFVNFGVNLMHFSGTNCFYLFKKAPRTRQQSVSLLNVVDVLSHQVFRKIDKSCIKFSKIWIFKCFCQFRSIFDGFF